VLFLDEPTASLDPAATKAVEGIVGAAAGGGIKIEMATHDVGQARRLAGDIILLLAGLVVERATAARLFASPGTEQARSFLAGDLVIRCGGKPRGAHCVRRSPRSASRAALKTARSSSHLWLTQGLGPFRHILPIFKAKTGINLNVCRRAQRDIGNGRIFTPRRA
jgi:ABC-type multidrug transport system ATPase subunit